MNLNKNLRQIAMASFERQKLLDAMHKTIFDLASAALHGTARDHKQALAAICKLIDPKYEVPLNKPALVRVQKALGLVKTKAAPDQKAKRAEDSGKEAPEKGRLKPGTHVRQI